MDGIAVGMEKSHHSNLKPTVVVLGKSMAQLRVDLKGFNHFAAGIQAPSNLHHGLSQKGSELRLKSKQFTAVLVTNAELVGQTGVGEEQHGSLLVLQQRIGGHRGSQPDTADDAGGDCTTRVTPHQIRHCGNGRISAVRRLRQQLADMQPALWVATDQIGERTPPIHPERPSHQSVGDNIHHPAVPVRQIMVAISFDPERIAL